MADLGETVPVSWLECVKFADSRSVAGIGAAERTGPSYANDNPRLSLGPAPRLPVSYDAARAAVWLSSWDSQVMPPLPVSSWR